MTMKTRLCWLLALFAASSSLKASEWEWQVQAGPWSLQPLTSPVERLAGRIVADETAELLAPLLSEFTISGFSPEVDMRSRGALLLASLWRRLAAGRFAAGASLAFLRGEIPFYLQGVQVIDFEGIPLAQIAASGEGRIDLNTFLLAVRGRWRAWRQGRTSLHLEGGLALLRLRGTLTLPIRVRLQTPLGLAELSYLEEITLGELGLANGRLPSWSLSPALAASLHQRLNGRLRLVLEAGLGQGTYLGAGLGLDL